MPVGETLRLAWRSLWRNRLRAILTMLGMIIGVSAVILLSALGNGATAQVVGAVQSLGSNLLIVLPQGVNQGGINQGSSGAQPLSFQEADLIQAQDFSVQAVAPMVGQRVQVIWGANNYGTQLQGTTANYPRVQSAPIAEGRFFTAQEVQRSASVAVIGQTVATSVFPTGMDPVGQQIELNGIPFTVIGLLKAQGTNGALNQDDRIIVPISTAMNQLTGSQNLSAIYLSAATAAAMPLAESEVTNTLSTYLHVPPGGTAPFRVLNQTTIVSALSTITSVLTTLLAGVAAISLIVGGIGIMNIMLVSVVERTSEIGLRKAIGATRGAILSQFLTESIMVSCTGGLIGVLLGIGSSLLASRVLSLPLAITLSPVLVALGFSVAVGLVFGVYPARQAARMSPIEALRSE